jgi:hypothetical protein
MGVWFKPARKMPRAAVWLASSSGRAVYRHHFDAKVIDN